MMASPFAFAWMLLKDSARVADDHFHDWSQPSHKIGSDIKEAALRHNLSESETSSLYRQHMKEHGMFPSQDAPPFGEFVDSQMGQQSQHPPMPRPEDEGPTMGEMADMSPEEKEFEMSIARRRNAPKPEDPAQRTLHDFD